ncbi:MAG: restriction endonuclease, SacI family [Chloroflexota bacterium]|nr:restriction endonuclease, SacI family [Chloroflexota bacterium]
MNNEETREWLDSKWEAVLAEEDLGILETDRFIDSSVVSIRYALLTQLLGKLADLKRDLLCLQKGDSDDEGESGRWDPRSFCASVVVPWVQKNDSVLGKSTDPYVNNQLRVPRLDSEANRKNQAEWNALTEYLRRIEDSDTPEASVEAAVMDCLRSIAKRASKSRITYPVPFRINLDDLCEMVSKYLATPSGGVRAQGLATALLQTLGEAFSLFDNVEATGVNEADSASGKPGDIICYDDDGNVTLAIEVKDRDLTLVEFDNTLNKAQSAGTQRVLFVVPRMSPGDTDQVQDKIKAEWAKGRDIHSIWIVDLIRSTFMLLEETWRVEFIERVGVELDRRGVALTHRQAWADLLR